MYNKFFKSFFILLGILGVIIGSLFYCKSQISTNTHTVTEQLVKKFPHFNITYMDHSIIINYKGDNPKQWLLYLTGHNIYIKHFALNQTSFTTTAINEGPTLRNILKLPKPYEPKKIQIIEQPKLCTIILKPHKKTNKINTKKIKKIKT